MTDEKRQEIQDALDKLNRLVGTTGVDAAEREVSKLLPKGWYLGFEIHSAQYCIVDHMGARVL